jgi:hypothetical protein
MTKTFFYYDAMAQETRWAGLAFTNQRDVLDRFNTTNISESFLSGAQIAKIESTTDEDGNVCCDVQLLSNQKTRVIVY